MNGVPAPYNRFSSPLARTQAGFSRGAAVYAQNCASCHGDTGHGGGPAGGSLSPPPADLAWLSDMPMHQLDPFMYWTIAEGGTPFGTAMPSFKTKLSKGDMWSVISYIQSELPKYASAGRSFGPRTGNGAVVTRFC
jgi:mono/diheme cytochrome c family protein